MTYKEQLKHGAWLQFRNEVFKRDNFKCRICGTKNSLQTHHLYYLPDTLAWEYDFESVVTLCEKHHNQITYDLPKIAGHIAFEILTKKYTI